MKLEKKKILIVSFMLFSLFFGAGNLIFPPFLGQCAGRSMPMAIIGFLVTAVILPVLGVIVVAKFGGLDKLAARVNSKFAVFFTVLIFLSIGPGLGIPRAASVPFEMAIAPYLPEGASFAIFMLIYSLLFFLVAGWLAIEPKKLVDRLGKYLTPTLLVLLVIISVSFLIYGTKGVKEPVDMYAEQPFVKGFLEGYQTMDTIAALNFGFVIAGTLYGLNMKSKKDVMHYTKIAGVIAGTILALIYVMLSFIGMQSSGVYELKDNGAWILRNVTTQLFGTFGAWLLAIVFTLACLTTCVGLITSVSQYFASLSKKLTYRKWVCIIVGFSFIVCNQGLTTILGISVPVLNAIYPMSIMLIVLGLFGDKLKNNKFIYPLTISLVGVVSVLYALEQLNVPLGFLGKGLSCLPFYSYGLGWVVVAFASMALGVVAQLVYNKVKGNDNTNCCEDKNVEEEVK